MPALTSAAGAKSTKFAAAGAIIGAAGTVSFFMPVSVSDLSVPLSVLGVAFSVIALTLPPRNLLLGGLGFVLSAPPVAFVLWMIAVGIRC